MKIITTTLIAAAISLAAAAGSPAQEADPEMLKTLGGQALQPNPSGFKPRGPIGSEIKTETRRVFFTPRGIWEIPDGIEAFDSESKATVEKKAAPRLNEDSAHGELSVKGGEEAYEVKYKVDPTSQLSTTSIKFVKGGVDLADADSKKFLASLAATLQDRRLAKFKYVIEGHASAEDSAERNQILSQERANAIFHYLVGEGVPSAQIIPVGFGESRARFPDTSPEHALAQDRRALIFKLED